MAILASHGSEIDLGGGVKRRYVVIADASAAATEILPLGSGFRRILAGELAHSAGGKIEVKSSSSVLWFLKPPSSGVINLGDVQRLVSVTATNIQIEADAAMTIEGYIDYIEGDGLRYLQ